VREFARDILKLNVGGSYATYASVDAAQIVHVVMAAERFRLEPYTRWFPIVGRVPYKGYFAAEEARSAAASLETDGFDTYVRTSAAFSTLGWFDDPLLSTVLRRDRVDLVDTVIHELLHNTTYIGGQARFDESFANFVGHRGAIAFFQTETEANAAEQAENQWADALRFSGFLTAFAAELADAYAAGVTLEERARLFARAQERFLQLPFLGPIDAGFASIPLNNAIVLHKLLYFDRLALFEEAFALAEEDLGATIRMVIDAASTDPDDPFAALATALGGRRLSREKHRA
jgi:predicted aminopeptidase